MQKANLLIEGMSCSACVNRINKAILTIDGVIDISISLMQNQASIVFDENKISLDNIIHIINNLGYKAFAKEPGQKVYLLKFRQQENYRLICTIILTAIILILVMGSMFDLQLNIDLKVTIYAQLLITLIIFFIQKPILINGIKSFIELTFNMDSLVALGAFASFFYSLINIYHLSASNFSIYDHARFPLYFESACCILCFVGIGKFLENKIKYKSTNALSKLMALKADEASILVDGKEQLVTENSLKLGDLVVLKEGASAICDGVVVKGQGYIDESKLTGESIPVKKVLDAKILSGSTLISGYIVFKATKIGKDSTYGQIISLIEQALSKKSKITAFTDKISKFFVPTIIVIAIATFFGHILSGLSTTQAFNFAISVLVVSCPCALGLATPAALAAGAGRAASLGILFKHPDAIELLAKIDTLAFDKTGTLTYGRMQILKIFGAPLALHKLYTNFARSIEVKSSHPIARAFISDSDELVFDVINFSTILGQGVQGYIGHDKYALLNLKGLKLNAVTISKEIENEIIAHENDGLKVVSLVKNCNYLCSFLLGDKIKEDAKNAILALQSLHVNPLLLTGDHDKSAAFICNKLGIKNFKAHLLPQDKATFIQRLKDSGKCVAMLGDGVNDAPSLSIANVGMCVYGSSDIALLSGQVIFLKDNLNLVSKAILLSRKIVLNIKENLFWAFIYNLIAIPIACGLFYSSYGLAFNPMISAILMSLSSIFVVTNASRLAFVKLDSNKNSNDGVKMQKIIHIEGMSCNHCVKVVTEALSACPGISDVQVSLVDKKAQCNIDANISDDFLKTVIESVGFNVTGIK